MNNLLDYDYDTLVDALEHDKFRTNLAEAMKRDFLLFYRVMFFLMNMQHLSTPPVIKKLATELQNSYYNIVDTAIFAPPGIGKTLTKEFFFAWTFCREKQTKWIYSNSVSEQVKRRSQEVRDIVFNKFSYKLFNNKIDPRLKSAELLAGYTYTVDGAEAAATVVLEILKNHQTRTVMAWNNPENSALAAVHAAAARAGIYIVSYGLADG